MNEDDPIVEHFGGVPLRRSQVARMLDGEARLAEIRKRAGYKPNPDARLSSGIGVSCAKCEHLGDFSDEAQRGFCGQLRHMVSTWHNCSCGIFLVRTTAKASDVLKAEMARQDAERAAAAQTSVKTVR